MEKGPHKDVEVLSTKDVNHLFMVKCNICGTYAHASSEDIALRDLSNVKCVTDCENCKNLRNSTDIRPAVPINGSCNNRLHICPNDGNRWWQFNGYFHLWKQVTSNEEWFGLIDQKASCEEDV